MEWYNDAKVLEIICKAGAAAYTPRQVAYMIGQPITEFLAQFNTEDSPVNAAYYQGFYSSEMAIRESAFTLARNGSSPAQTLALKLFDDTRKTILKDEHHSEI